MSCSGHLSVHAWRRATVQPALAPSACAMSCTAEHEPCLWAPVLYAPRTCSSRRCETQCSTVYW
jgi:hypothetical protein